MSNLFNSQCSVPTFMQVDKTVVSDCGKINAYIFCSVVTIILLVAGFTQNSKINKNTSLSASDKKTKKLSLLLIITASIILSWIILPFLFSFLSVNSWESYQNQISDLMSQGYTRKQAIGKIQSLYQTQQTAMAIEDAGAEIGSGDRY